MTQNIDNVLVSIVISAYNEEKYLPGLIEDLKNQQRLRFYLLMLCLRIGQGILSRGS